MMNNRQHETCATEVRVREAPNQTTATRMSAYMHIVRYITSAYCLHNLTLQGRSQRLGAFTCYTVGLLLAPLSSHQLVSTSSEDDHSSPPLLEDQTHPRTLFYRS